MLRYAEPRDFDGDGKFDATAWQFYHIFGPEDLTSGDHTFDIGFYVKNSLWMFGMGDYSWSEWTSIWYRDYVDPPYDVQSLIIRIV